MTVELVINSKSSVGDIGCVRIGDDFNTVLIYENSQKLNYQIWECKNTWITFIRDQKDLNNRHIIGAMCD